MQNHMPLVTSFFFILITSGAWLHSIALTAWLTRLS
ncbi:exported hypothetical protein [Verrucomicrobia bacterium]|nr:exported hypothetical protein [Verrucomicrobiota bacterium]